MKALKNILAPLILFLSLATANNVFAQKIEFKAARSEGASIDGNWDKEDKSVLIFDFDKKTISGHETFKKVEDVQIINYASSKRKQYRFKIGEQDATQFAVLNVFEDEANEDILQTTDNQYYIESLYGKAKTLSK